jgi:DNA-directed RNA polymerase subunit RPC12/RpoP
LKEKDVDVIHTHKEDKVRCDRCTGIMVHEIFFGLHEYFWGWRCIICGEIIDPVILENRRGYKIL